MKVTTHLINANDADEAALEALCARWNSFTISMIEATINIAERTNKTTVYMAKWDDADTCVTTAYVQEYDTDLNLYQVQVTY
jgi:hypothetical protein